MSGGVSEEDLDGLCLEHIARFKRPRAYRFIEALPKNNYGKVLKTALREMAGGRIPGKRWMMEPRAAPYSKEMSFSRLKAAYASGGRAPSDVVHEVCERIAARGEDGVWIHVEPEEKLLARARKNSKPAGRMRTHSPFTAFPSR